MAAAVAPALRMQSSEGTLLFPGIVYWFWRRIDRLRRGPALAGRRRPRQACAGGELQACAGGELRSLAGRRRPRLAQARAGGGLLSPAVAALDRDVLVASCSRGLLSPSVAVFLWLYFCGAICGC